MCAAPLSRDLALRIGVAARGLPKGGLRGLMDALVENLGLPLTAEKLVSLTMQQLRSASNDALSHLPRAKLRLALGYLHGVSHLSGFGPGDPSHQPAPATRRVQDRARRAPCWANRKMSSSLHKGNQQLRHRPFDA
jgi:hypothetical protein